MNDLDQELDLLAPIGPPGKSDSVTGDEHSAEADCEKFVAFFLGDNLYGVQSAAVAEVSHPLSVTPLPAAPELLIGIASLRGEVIAVINLRKLIGEESQNASPKPKLVILKEPGGDGDTQIAFPVDKMHEIVISPRGQISGVSGECVTGQTRVDSGLLRILDTSRFSIMLAAV